MEVEVHEVRLVFENDGWYLYQDDRQVLGGWYKASDEAIAKREARDLAKKLSPCEFIMIDVTGMEKYHENY